MRDRKRDIERRGRIEGREQQTKNANEGDTKREEGGIRKKMLARSAGKGEREEEEGHMEEREEVRMEEERGKEEREQKSTNENEGDR